MYTLEKFEKEIEIPLYITHYVNVEEFLRFCKACPNYDKLWSCPSYDFNPEEYWKKFSTLLVFGYKINFVPGITEKRSMEIMSEVKNKIAEELFAMEENFPGSISLSAGSCSICGPDGCSRSSGKACIFPEKMRYSIESLGGNVGKTVSKLLGIELEWIEEGKVPSYFVLVGGLLKK
ncbi:MAG: DUF2284 domain-containing protein [Firmicutes bacterium]|nr:DUF2284 domain-containing protein [Bacillota bacterium]